MAQTSLQDRNHDAVLHARDIMLMERSYMGNPHFLAGTSWVARSLDGPKKLYSKSATSPMRCSIVGIISPEDLFMENHGNFVRDSPQSSVDDFRSALFSFKLNCPSSDQMLFKNDFMQSITNIKLLVDVLSNTDKTVSPFVVEDESVTLTFNRGVFQHHSCYGQDEQNRNLGMAYFGYRGFSLHDTHHPSSLENYYVREAYRPYIRMIKFEYLARNVNVWDRSGAKVPSDKRNNFLRNKLAQVYFTISFVPKMGLVVEFDSVSVFSEELSQWENFI